MGKFRDIDLGQYWDEQEAILSRTKELGLVLIFASKSRVLVSSPYSEEFVRVAHKLNGRWRNRTKRWSFSINEMEAVISSCTDIYGKGAIRLIKYNG